jgi:hypothetical protein
MCVNRLFTAIFAAFLSIIYIPFLNAAGVYDFAHLKDAQYVIEKSTFLPEEIKKIFIEYSKTYDRQDFKDYLDEFGELELMKKIYLGILDEDTKKLIKPHLDMLAKMELDHFKPYFDQINNEIREKGRFATNLFDGFFYHIHGVGQQYKGFYSEEESKRIFGEYPLEEISKLITQLKELGFLKENSNFDYNPHEKLEEFLANRDPAQITTLIIAGGHRGRHGIYSISPYKNALTLDLSPLVSPDLIMDINDSDFLDVLLSKFRGRLSLIEDASNESDAAIFSPGTLEKILELLKPGGQLVLSTNASRNVGVVSKKTETFLRERGFTPLEFREVEGGEKLPLGRFVKSSE